MLGFLMCAVFGAVLLVAQLVAGVADADAGHHATGSHAVPGHAASGHADGGHFLHALAGLRPIAAGLTFFGLTGAGLRAGGTAWTVTWAGALAAALLAAAATALLLRSLLRLDSDGAVRLERALGAEATVYVPIPPGGVGKVQLALHGRLIESSATAVDGAAYATGARVLVVDHTPDGGLLVAADPAAPDRRGSPSLPRSLAL